MTEHERIARFFAPLTAAEPGAFDLLDDAAVLTPPAGKSLVVTTDSVIQGIHLIRGATPTQFAQKLVRRNLSDLAAMGATPWRYTINLNTPADAMPGWFDEFARVLSEEQRIFNMVLVGGDSTTSGDHVHATMTCFGLISGDPLRRNGAKPDDDIYVSGRVGDAAHWLKTKEEAYEWRYFRPEPRLALGQALQGVATAAIDISDGLLLDASRIATASGVGVSFARESIPRGSNHWETVLSGGDDYELIFTAPPSMRDAITALSKHLDLQLTRIGRVDAQEGLRVFDKDGADVTPEKLGYQH